MAKNNSSPNQTSQQPRTPRPQNQSSGAIPGTSSSSNMSSLPGISAEPLRPTVDSSGDNYNRVNRAAAQQRTQSQQSNYQLNQQSNIPGMSTNSTPPPSEPDPDRSNYKYGPMAGWDWDKLNNPDKHNTKYDFGRAAADFGVDKIKRGQLQEFVDYFNKTYGKNAKVKDDDEIDFSADEPTWNPIDIINGETEGLQWLI